MYCPPHRLRAIHPGTRCPGLPPHNACNDDAAFYLVAPTLGDFGRPVALPLCRHCADRGLLELRRIDHSLWSMQPAPILVRHPPYGYLHPATLELHPEPIFASRRCTPAELPGVYPATPCAAHSCQRDAAFYLVTPELRPLGAALCRSCAAAQLRQLLAIDPLWTVEPAPVYVHHPTAKTIHPYAGAAAAVQPP